MSSHGTKARLISIALVAATATVTATAAAIGWLGVPQSQATAALTDVHPSTAKAESAEFGTAIASAVPTSAAEQLMSPLMERRVAVKKRDVSRIRKLASGPWRQARASWYGPGFYGRTMASGGKLQRGSMVVAHKTMKFGTRIVFSYKGRSVVAVVKDRGPYVSGRAFDLGPGTAKALRFQGVGTVKYRVL